MLKITKERRITWPVTVNEPQDGGTTKKRQITAHFKLIPADRIDEIVAARTTGDKDQDILREVLVGWEGITDGDGNSMAFTEGNLAIVLGVPYVRLAMLDGYFQAANGKAAEKN